MSPNPTDTVLVRLKRRRDFLAAAGAKRKWAMPGMVVQVRGRKPDEDQIQLVRVGFTTSRKVGNAVIRNRVRRRLRACVDAILPGTVKPGLDIVVIGRAASAERSFDALKADLMKSLKKLDAFKISGDGAPGSADHAH